MLFDLIFPEESQMYEAECIIAAVFFDEEELKSLGYEENSFEMNPSFIEANEFEKAFLLWGSPLFLSDFFNKNEEFFKNEYWRGISEETFLKDVSDAIAGIKKELIDRMENNDFHSLVEPLDQSDDEKRLSESIRVKIKQGTIGGHHPFRFYAIEIEEKKCYLITGATIKIHKDMGKAPNTKIELKKLEYVLDSMFRNEVNTNELIL